MDIYIKPVRNYRLTVCGVSLNSCGLVNRGMNMATGWSLNMANILLMTFTASLFSFWE